MLDDLSHNRYPTRLDPPSEQANLTWRKMVSEDLEGIVRLSKAGLMVDGGLPFLFESDFLQSRYFPDSPGTGIVGFTPDGRVVSCAAAHLVDTQKVLIVGLVHPDQRRKGIGTYLMDWSQSLASRLLSAVGNGIMQIATESLSEPAHRLYLRHGFTSVFEEVVMRYDLDVSLPEHPLPADASLTSWRPELAEEFYQAYYEAFRERPGFPGWSAGEWIGYVTEDDHIPEWSLLAYVNGKPAGFVIGNIDLTTDPPGAYVWQVGVVPAQRRRGLASVLLAESLRRMRSAGAVSAFLTVHINNPGAYQAYALLGFTTIGRRARYERVIE